jgi:hypothetical protein
MGQRVEDVRTFAGQRVTLSFWARSTAGAQPLGYALFQNFGTGGSPSSMAQATQVTGSGPYTPSASWQRYSYTFDLPSISGKTIGTNNDSYLLVRPMQFTATTTNTSVDIWGVQLEAGSIETPFTTATGTIQGELAACQRYYYKIGPSDGSSSSFLYSPLGMANATTQVIVTFPFPQIMRVKPISIEYTNPRVSDGANVSTATSLVLGDASSSLGSVNVNGSGFTVFRNYWMMNNSNSSLAFNAEL